jgi:hypothetical protein
MVNNVVLLFDDADEALVKLNSRWDFQSLYNKLKYFLPLGCWMIADGSGATRSWRKLFLSIISANSVENNYVLCLTSEAVNVRGKGSVVFSLNECSKSSQCIPYFANEWVNSR